MPAESPARDAVTGAREERAGAKDGNPRDKPPHCPEPPSAPGHLRAPPSLPSPPVQLPTAPSPSPALTAPGGRAAPAGGGWGRRAQRLREAPSPRRAGRRQGGRDAGREGCREGRRDGPGAPPVPARPGPPAGGSAGKRRSGRCGRRSVGFEKLNGYLLPSFSPHTEHNS